MSLYLYIIWCIILSWLSALINHEHYRSPESKLDESIGSSFLFSLKKKGADNNVIKTMS